MPSLTIAVPVGITFLKLHLSDADLQHLGNIVAQHFKGTNLAGCCRIVSKHSGKCLDVADWSKQDGASIQQYTPHGGENQLWSILPLH